MAGYSSQSLPHLRITDHLGELGTARISPMIMTHRIQSRKRERLCRSRKPITVLPKPLQY
jgi:hypothetical protein